MEIYCPPVMARTGSEQNACFNIDVEIVKKIVNTTDGGKQDVSLRDLVNEFNRLTKDISNDNKYIEDNQKINLKGLFLRNFTDLDLDECYLGHPCNTNAECTNFDGGYDCTCFSGYSGDGDICEDIDECKAEISCQEHSYCLNTDGSYECKCKSGYEFVESISDGRGICMDINECWLKQHDCHANASCSNYDGGYDCTCNDGYAGDGRVCSGIYNKIHT